MDHQLKPEDTFKFTCKMCGSCCKKRKEPILMTGTDIFYIGKALNIQPLEVINNYMDCYIGHDSKVPVCTLLERKDGRCVLMKKYKCRVQNMKPVVCALFPLGRMLALQKEENGELQEEQKYIYFTQPEDRGSCIGCRDGEERTLQSWLDEFNIEQRDRETMAWQKMMLSLSQFIRGLNPAEVDEERHQRIMTIVMGCLYLNYPLNRDYIESINENRRLLKLAFDDIKFIDEV